jgi:predicted DNA-binding transcriptional regulator AlpA
MKQREAAQVELARRAAKLKAANAAKARLAPNLITANQQAQHEMGLAAKDDPREHDRERVHGARAPPRERLLDKADILAITNVSFPTIWTWQRAGLFPRSRIVGGKSMWLASEIDAWLSTLPVRPLKGDAPSEEEVA